MNTTTPQPAPDAFAEAVKLANETLAVVANRIKNDPVGYIAWFDDSLGNLAKAVLALHAALTEAVEARDHAKFMCEHWIDRYSTQIARADSADRARDEARAEAAVLLEVVINLRHRSSMVCLSERTPEFLSPHYLAVKASVLNELRNASGKADPEGIAPIADALLTELSVLRKERRTPGFTEQCLHYIGDRGFRCEYSPAGASLCSLPDCPIRSALTTGADNG